MRTLLDIVKYTIVPLLFDKPQQKRNEELKKTVEHAKTLDYIEIFNKDQPEENDRKRKGEPEVENENGDNGNSKRLMSELTHENMIKPMRALKTKLQKVAKELHKTLSVDEMVVLWSKKGCEAQTIHTDNVITTENKEAYVISGLVALEDGTKLEFGLVGGKTESVSVDKGSCILFRSNRAHGGASYRDSNYRIHFIMKDKTVKLKQSVVRKTWLCIYENCVCKPSDEKRRWTQHIKYCSHGGAKTQAARDQRNEAQKTRRLKGKK